MKNFWLARRSDGHRFNGSKIDANDAKDAENVYRRLGYNVDYADLMIVGAQK